MMGVLNKVLQNQDLIFKAMQRRFGTIDPVLASLKKDVKDLAGKVSISCLISSFRFLQFVTNYLMQ